MCVCFFDVEAECIGVDFGTIGEGNAFSFDSQENSEKLQVLVSCQGFFNHCLFLQDRRGGRSLGGDPFL